MFKLVLKSKYNSNQLMLSSVINSKEAHIPEYAGLQYIDNARKELAEDYPNQIDTKIAPIISNKYTIDVPEEFARESKCFDFNGRFDLFVPKNWVNKFLKVIYLLHYDCHIFKIIFKIIVDNKAILEAWKESGFKKEI